MKMVKTFIKTQHQHVMPPEKGRKKEVYKAKGLALHRPGRRSSSRPPPRALEDGGMSDSVQDKHNTPRHPSLFFCSVA